MVIFTLVPFIIILLIVLFIFGYRSKTEEGEDQMRNIYVYLVLFATLMMAIGGSVSVFMALADIVSPAPYHQSFEEYRQLGADYNETDVKGKSEEELREGYDAMIKNDKELAMERSINMLIKSFGWIVIPLPIFIYFQRRITKKV